MMPSTINCQSKVEDISQVLFKSGGTNSTGLNQITINQNDHIKQCRICLEESTVLENPNLISPCLCSGSVNHVHFKCLSNWIQKHCTVPIKDVKKSGTYLCQMCKYKIKFQSDIFLTCNDKEVIRQLISQKCSRFVLYVCIIILCICFLAIGIFLTNYLKELSLTQEFYRSSVIVISFVVISVILVIILGQLISQFLVKRVFKVLSIKQYKPKQSTHQMNTENDFWLFPPQNKRDRRNSVCPEVVIQHLQ